METTLEHPPETSIDDPNPPGNSDHGLATNLDGVDSPENPRSSDHDLLEELESLRGSYQALQSKSSAMEENLLMFQQQRDAAISRQAERTEAIDELSRERDSLRSKIDQFEASLEEKQMEFAKRVEEEVIEKEYLKKELEVSRKRIEELESDKKVISEFLGKNLNSIRSVKENLVKLIEGLDDEKVVIDRVDDASSELELEEEFRVFQGEIGTLLNLATESSSKLSEYKEARKKEKRELESSVVSLTEENRDINNLLRVALVEKEAVEKSLNKLKGNSDQKRVALLQFAERGLQRVGFGFMMGGAPTGNNEQAVESSAASTTSTTASKSDGSESEEEVVSLASTVERIMKNLRLEISQLRRALEESRSDTERLQSLTEKQAQKIEENTVYIKELEDRERVLAQHAEDLLMEIKETEAEVARWREACELEVEAGKTEIEERDKLVVILKQELEKTKAALDISNGKLKLKEELAAAAMAAQAAAEKSLQLADGRAAELRERIEELTKQLEEAENREKKHRKGRRICWPWQFLKMHMTANSNTGVQNVRRMLPEMQALLHPGA
ncbi:hypothetical protein SLEP1_g39888 [Rubroshorea leprosula]|uniref:Uncharacterized protein n=2 Tax=Rubroshorea leprosula TaxID=152421 RepID=A0AAV5L1X2_9ROSI|nr:hypothetical protein SLEP1_g39888 [Rubroshorea leprosula]